MPGIRDALNTAFNKTANFTRPFAETVGGHWARDNARFEQTNPSFGRRMLRAIHPATGFGFGPAMGQVYDGVGNGQWGQAAVGAGLAAIPMGAATIKTAVNPIGRSLTAQGLKRVARPAPTAAGVGALMTADAAADSYFSRRQGGR
jgi:hypothetical protein